MAVHRRQRPRSWTDEDYLVRKRGLQYVKYSSIATLAAGVLFQGGAAAAGDGVNAAKVAHSGFSLQAREGSVISVRTGLACGDGVGSFHVPRGSRKRRGEHCDDQWLLRGSEQRGWALESTSHPGKCLQRQSGLSTRLTVRSCGLAGRDARWHLFAFDDGPNSGKVSTAGSRKNDHVDSNSEVESWERLFSYYLVWNTWRGQPLCLTSSSIPSHGGGGSEHSLRSMPAWAGVYLTAGWDLSELCTSIMVSAAAAKPTRKDNTCNVQCDPSHQSGGRIADASELDDETVAERETESLDPASSRNSAEAGIKVRHSSSHSFSNFCSSETDDISCSSGTSSAADTATAMTLTAASATTLAPSTASSMPSRARERRSADALDEDTSDATPAAISSESSSPPYAPFPKRYSAFSKASEAQRLESSRSDHVNHGGARSVRSLMRASKQQIVRLNNHVSAALTASLVDKARRRQRSVAPLVMGSRIAPHGDIDEDHTDQSSSRVSSSSSSSSTIYSSSPSSSLLVSEIIPSQRISSGATFRSVAAATTAGGLRSAAAPKPSPPHRHPHRSHRSSENHRHPEQWVEPRTGLAFALRLDHPRDDGGGAAGEETEQRGWKDGTLPPAHDDDHEEHSQQLVGGGVYSKWGLSVYAVALYAETSSDAFVASLTYGGLRSAAAAIVSDASGRGNKEDEQHASRWGEAVSAEETDSKSSGSGEAKSVVDRGTNLEAWGVDMADFVPWGVLGRAGVSAQERSKQSSEKNDVNKNTGNNNSSAPDSAATSLWADEHFFLALGTAAAYDRTVSLRLAMSLDAGFVQTSVMASWKMPRSFKWRLLRSMQGLHEGLLKGDGGAVESIRSGKSSAVDSTSSASGTVQGIKLPRGTELSFTWRGRTGAVDIRVNGVLIDSIREATSVADAREAMASLGAAHNQDHRDRDGGEATKKPATKSASAERPRGTPPLRALDGFMVPPVSMKSLEEAMDRSLEQDEGECAGHAGPHAHDDERIATEVEHVSCPQYRGMSLARALMYVYYADDPATLISPSAKQGFATGLALVASSMSSDSPSPSSSSSSSSSPLSTSREPIHRQTSRDRRPSHMQHVKDTSSAVDWRARIRDAAERGKVKAWADHAMEALDSPENVRVQIDRSESSGDAVLRSGGSTALSSAPLAAAASLPEATSTSTSVSTSEPMPATATVDTKDPATATKVKVSGKTFSLLSYSYSYVLPSSTAALATTVRRFSPLSSFAHSSTPPPGSSASSLHHQHPRRGPRIGLGPDSGAAGSTESDESPSSIASSLGSWEFGVKNKNGGEVYHADVEDECRQIRFVGDSVGRINRRCLREKLMDQIQDAHQQLRTHHVKRTKEKSWWKRWRKSMTKKTKREQRQRSHPHQRRQHEEQDSRRRRGANTNNQREKKKLKKREKALRWVEFVLNVPLPLSRKRNVPASSSTESAPGFMGTQFAAPTWSTTTAALEGNSWAADKSEPWSEYVWRLAAILEQAGARAPHVSVRGSLVAPMAPLLRYAVAPLISHLEALVWPEQKSYPPATDEASMRSATSAAARKRRWKPSPPLFTVTSSEKEHEHPLWAWWQRQRGNFDQGVQTQARNLFVRILEVNVADSSAEEGFSSMVMGTGVMILLLVLTGLTGRKEDLQHDHAGGKARRADSMLRVGETAKAVLRQFEGNAKEDMELLLPLPTAATAMTNPNRSRNSNHAYRRRIAAAHVRRWWRAVKRRRISPSLL